MVDGLGHLFGDFDVAAVHREAFGARAFYADAHDGGDAGAGFGAVDGDVDGQLKSHVETHYTASAHQLEHLLLMLGIESGVLAGSVWDVLQIGGVAVIEWAVDDLFNEVRQLEVHLFFIRQGQRVAFAAWLNDEEGIGCVAFNLEAKRQGFALGGRPEYVVERATQIDLGVQQLQGAVIEFELDHAAHPPLFGSNGAGAGRPFCLGFVGMNAQPDSRAKRRISKMWEGSAAAGWTCSVAVVCMVSPRSVVEE